MSESTDLSALKARLEDVEARQAILDAEKNAIREEILKECASLCAKFRFTARELRLPSEVKPRSAVSGAAFAPKYKNPDGPETWSGRETGVVYRSAGSGHSGGSDAYQARYC